MSGFAIKGWCPSALRPMLSGDGLLVRVRARGGRLCASQATAIADLAERHGNGFIDVTARANLQIRGVREQGYEALISALAALDLIDTDVDTEGHRNILVAPFWRDGDETQSLATELERALSATPLGLPQKFGFAVDCGTKRVLAHSSADVRIERGATGGLIVRADGAQQGRAVASGEAVEVALVLAKWFVASGGAKGGRGRMAAHVGSGASPPLGLAGDASPAPAMLLPSPCLHRTGALVGLAFGQMTSATLKFLATLAPGLRMTPWRMILIEGLGEMPRHDGLVTRADDPLLRVVACTGAPACAEAHVETRRLAAALAPGLPAGARLHVSGCAKGCAQPGRSAITLVGTAGGLDLVRDGTTRDPPTLRGLSPAGILDRPFVLTGALG
jgi:precorrin-3B synthase